VLRNDPSVVDHSEEAESYLLLEAGDLVALGVYERALGLAGDDVPGLLGERQQLADLLQTLRLPVAQLFLWRGKERQGRGKKAVLEISNTRSN
jgi:hypothetical protein